MNFIYHTLCAGTDKLDDPNACPGGKEGALEQAKDSGKE